MKFITSRIVSPKQTKSLMEIIAENKQTKEETTDTATVKTSSTSKKNTKVATQKKNKAKQKIEAKVKKMKIKKVSATSSNTKRIFQKVAKLSDKDNNFLKEYFTRYYPADYVEALLANY